MGRGLAFLISVFSVAYTVVAGGVSYRDVEVTRNGSNIEVSASVVLDSLKLGSNRQLYISAVLRNNSDSVRHMPQLLVNGRNMHIAMQRGTLPATPASKKPVIAEIRRKNNTAQSYTYKASVPFEQWMIGNDTRVEMVTDSCGCGVESGSSESLLAFLDLNPWQQMKVDYIVPEVTDAPVSIHEGSARVQFEVDRTELHPLPYRCRNGQTIDNREQLAVIDDSIHYALTDPNVEIAKIRIVGYASPESPYDHNAFLAFNRSKALVDYLAQKYNLSPESREYDAVPENWEEFRILVENSDEISETERADLLELIARPVYDAAGYDAKELELKKSPKFSRLYRRLILPVWFPKLRATKFAITTRLRPLTDPQLAEVFDRTPELMSLNQMFRVAKLYPEGSEQFRQTVDKILQYYPDSDIALVNAAAAAVATHDLNRAEQLLEAAGNSPQAENLRGIIATSKGELAKAGQLFETASSIEVAAENAALLTE